MFDRILIANRGEIACRVITTAHAMGVGTVAVYSDADRGARHVAMADSAVRIGPAPAADSYLNGAAIIRAAQDTGAQAIHPGYGFLSENPEFAQAVADAGLTFVGPPAAAIRAMGLKDAAKSLMERAGVPVVPGYHGADQDPGRLAEEAARVGYPVLIKARAGGGGKGMRLVEKAAGFADALAGAQREAQASFGDPGVLIERCITHPRHIEIQVLADAHGNVVHLFERDCSLQRRHQKVIEEAPAPGMTEDVRAAMGAAAVEAARAIGYAGVGTVEFIVDASGPLRPDGFWFMEMNTRLQVEHPVTEAITGLDLVEMQLRVADGEVLPFAQDDLSIDGHAFEARIYAEDVAAGFLPATGRLDRLTFPEAVAFSRGPVRIDSGVVEGDRISAWYDPMIAKVIAHGPTRTAALSHLTEALDKVRIGGTRTNLEFLSSLSRHQRFATGQVDTGLIARDMTELVDDRPATLAALGLAAAGHLGLLPPSRPLAGWRLWDREVRTVAIGGATVELEITADAVSVLGDDGWEPIDPSAEFCVGPDAVTVWVDGRTHLFPRPDPLVGGTAEAAAGDAAVAPMPGVVKHVAVAPGQVVSQGAALAVVEAMKMEHTLTAPRDGVVAEVLAAPGDRVDAGQVLVRLEVP